MANETMGTRLLRLKERSGLTLDNIAKAADFRRASSIQRYFSPDYDAPYLPRALADRLKEALVGFGDPAINPSDVDRLTEFGFLHDRKLPRPISPELFRRANQNVIECSASYPDEFDGIPVEAFRIVDDPLRTFERPAHLQRRPLASFYVSTITMSPRYNPGEIVIVESERPPITGQDVLVGLNVEVTGWYAVLGTLVARSREAITLEVLQPAMRFDIPLTSVDGMSPVLSVAELLAPSGTQAA